MLYEIPVSQLKAYRGKDLVIRTQNPNDLLATLCEKDLEGLAAIRIENPDCELNALQDASFSGPLDIVLRNPDQDAPKLYAFSPLVESHPLRVTIPVRPGFTKAVRVAAALHMAVKLDIGQPDEDLIPELLEALEFYLHSPGVTQAIEFFHSLLFACQGRQPISLWILQEEEPTEFRYVSENGVESFPGRLAALKELPLAPDAHQECQNCPYRSPCAGYFKWPDKTYACSGVKRVFEQLEKAATELSQDLASFHQVQKEARS